MINFGNMKLNNYVLFDEEEFDFGRTGITVINGLNHNSKKSKTTSPSNGSGKSLLASSLPSLILPSGSSPAITTSKVQTKKWGFYRKDSSLEISVKKDNSEATIKKFIKGSAFRYAINHDGKDLEAHTETAGKEWLESFIPFNDEQFYSLVYLDQRRPLTLVIGSDAQRFDYFDNLFKLDTYDQAQDIFKTVKSELADQKTKYDIESASLHSMKEEIKDLDKIIDKKDMVWVEFRKKEISKLQKQFFKLKQAEKKIEDVKSIDTSKKFDEEKYNNVVKNEKSITRKIQDIQAWIEYLEELEIYKVKSEKIKIKLDKNMNQSKIDSNTNISKEIRKLETRLASLKEDLKNYDEYVSEKKNLEKKLGKESYSEKEFKSIKSEYESVLQKCFSLRDKLNEFEDIKQFKSGKCPTCGSSVDYDHIVKEMKKIESQLNDKEKIKNKLLTKCDRIEQWIKVKKKFDNLKEIKKPEKSKISSLENKIKDLEYIEELQSAISKIEKPIKPKIEHEIKENVSKCKETLRSLEKDLKKLKQTIQEMEILKRSSNLMNELEQLGFKSLEKVKTAKQKFKDIDLSKMTNNVVTIQNSIEKKESLLKKSKNLEEKLEEMHDNLKKAKLIDILVSAFSNSGLKRYAAADIAKQVEANINDMAALIFAEKIKFHFDITDTKFNVCYEDTRGIFDVKTLNGAGSRSFTILAMLGILPLVHSSMRTNVLIMDEMDANMDRVSRDRLSNALVPALAEIVPHVIIVTPQDEVYPNALRVEVQKKGERATLVYEE